MTRAAIGEILGKALIWGLAWTQFIGLGALFAIFIADLSMKLLGHYCR